MYGCSLCMSSSAARGHGGDLNALPASLLPNRASADVHGWCRTRVNQRRSRLRVIGVVSARARRVPPLDDQQATATGIATHPLASGEAEALASPLSTLAARPRRARGKPAIGHSHLGMKASVSASLGGSRSRRRSAAARRLVAFVTQRRCWLSVVGSDGRFSVAPSRPNGKSEISWPRSRRQQLPQGRLRGPPQPRQRPLRAPRCRWPAPAR